MGDGIYTALTGAIAQQQTLDIVANNVANTQTIGFRGDKAVFGEMVRAAGSTQSANNGPKEDRFVTLDSVVRDVSGGMLRQTGNRLDFALQGDGFFVVRTNDGDKLTRAGNFLLREDGQLTTHDGGLVLGDDGHPLSLPTNTANIQVSQSGQITADGSPAGQFLIGTVADSRNLQKAGNAYLTAPADGKLMHATDVVVSQGFVELSNVNAVQGINELISINRSFDAIQKTIETFEKLNERSARELGARSG
jgi:flagellar basal-body rod protein FlgF